MNFAKRNTWTRIAVLASAAVALTTFASAQDYPPPPSFSPAQLDNLVARIALYPDPLLAQVLAASTFPDQVQKAAAYSFSHQNLQGQDLANAMYSDNLPWDVSVQALIPFPSVMDMMIKDMDWTSQLGNAVLAQRPDVMDAVQRMRRLSEQYGYLQNNDRIRVVADGPAIEIMPVDAGLIYVPAYDPYLVYAPPRPGFFVGAAIGFRTGFVIGAGFSNWGWGGGFDWHAHTVVVNHVAWGRTWSNRNTYVVNHGNSYADRWRPAPANRNITVNNVNVVRNERSVQPPQNWNANRPPNNSFVRNNPPAPAQAPRNIAPPARVTPPARVAPQARNERQAPVQSQARTERGREENRARR